MMNKYLLKMSGLAALVCTIHTSAWAQDDQVKVDTAVREDLDQNEIIIIPRSDKDAKLNIEIKDGKVFINGKPSPEYKDDNVTVLSRRIRNGSFNIQSDDLAFAPFPPASPFRKRGGATSAPGIAWSQSSNSRPFLGVSSQDAEDGAKITEITKGSAAEKCGLKEDDIITRIDDIKIDGPQSLSDAVRKYKPESKIVVTIKRNGKEQKINAVLGKTTTAMTMRSFNYAIPDMPDMPDAPNMGNMNFDFAPRGAYGGSGYYGSKAKLGIRAQDTEDGKGVKVLEVGDESAAQKAGVREGDVITTFNGKTIENATALSAMARAAAAQPNSPAIKLGVLREGKPMDIEVHIPKKLKTADL